METELRYAVSWRIDDVGLQFIADREAEGGAILHTYDDADLLHKPLMPGDPIKGTPTIGYGHTRTAKPGMRITEKEALELLRTDIREAESYVHRFVRVPLTQWQYNALVSIIFNVGPGRLPGANGPTDKGKSGIIVLITGKPSSLLESLNEGKYDVAATWFTAWKATKGFEFGLFRRRIAEMLMFMGLPWTRAYLACKSLQFTMAEAIRLGKEEKADIDGLKEPIVTVITDVPKPAPVKAKPLPEPVAPTIPDAINSIPTQLPVPGPVEDELFLDTPAAPIATDAKGSPPVSEPPSPSSQAAVPSSNPVPSVELSGPGTGPAAAEKVAPRPSAPPVAVPAPPVIAGQDGAKPMHPQTRMPEGVGYGIDPSAGAKPLESTERFVGAAMMWVANGLRVGMANGLKLSGPIGFLAVLFLDMMKQPVTAALICTTLVAIILAVGWFFGFVLDKAGLRKKKKGEAKASQLMYAFLFAAVVLQMLPRPTFGDEPDRSVSYAELRSERTFVGTII